MARAKAQTRGRAKGRRKGKVKTRGRGRESHQMRGKELDTSRQHQENAFPLHDLGSAIRMAAHSSMFMEDNCVKLSEVMQDRSLRKLQIDSSQRAQSVGHHKERQGKVKATVKGNDKSDGKIMNKVKAKGQGTGNGK